MTPTNSKLYHNSTKIGETSKINIIHMNNSDTGLWQIDLNPQNYLKNTKRSKKYSLFLQTKIERSESSTGSSERSQALPHKK